MKTKEIAKAICIATGLTLSVTAQAQTINNPKHIPNQFQNKINNVRLKGMTEKHSRRRQVRKEIGKQDLSRSRFGFSNRLSVIESEGCNIDVGNSQGGGIGSLSGGNTIIAGDVINVCK